MKRLKAVIPVAGLGTRLLPMTKAIPKEMLPIVDKPMIQYVVEECAAAGISDIVLVTHSSKNAIENHFDTSYELESMLEKRVQRQQLAELKSITPKGVRIMSIRQGLARGLGHAVHAAYPLIADAPFVVVLPDVLLDDTTFSSKTDNLANMQKQFQETGCSQILVEKIDPSQSRQYGMVALAQDQLKAGESSQLFAAVEKPAPEEAPSSFAIVGRYLFSATMWQCLAKTPLGHNDEIQLSDAINLLIEKEKVEAMRLVGQSHDCGNKLGYFKTNFLYTSRCYDILGE